MHGEGVAAGLQCDAWKLIRIGAVSRHADIVSTDCRKPYRTWDATTGHTELDD